MKAKASFKQDARLDIDVGDLITIIDGKPDQYWWKGQSNKNQRVGLFPRAILDPQRRLSPQDISKPLKNSFIHTGHGSNSSANKSWGSPSKIDEIFLNNPLCPPDLLGDIDESEIVAEEPVTAPNSSETLAQIVDSINLIDLSDESQLANEITVYHPNYFKASNNLIPVTPTLITSANNTSFTTTTTTSTINRPESAPPYINQSYQPNFLPNMHNSYYNDISLTYAPTNQISSCKSNNPFAQHQAYNNYQNESESSSERSSSNKSVYSGSSPPVKNYTQIWQKSAAPPLPPLSDTSKCQLFDAAFTFNSEKNLNVDDLLNKVMNDVIKDFDRIKYKPK